MVENTGLSVAPSLLTEAWEGSGGLRWGYFWHPWPKPDLEELLWISENLLLSYSHKEVMVGNRFFENLPGFWCSPFPELYFVFSHMADDGRHVCTWCPTHRWPHRETSGGTWPMLGPHILLPGVFGAVTKRVILIGAYLLELECYKLKSGGHTPLSWVWGIRESGAWDIEGWSRCSGKATPEPCVAWGRHWEGAADSRWFCSDSLSRKAEIHSFLLNLLKIHHVYTERAFLKKN